MFELNDQRPPVDGWITAFKPNLTYADGKVPRVDVIHLHHGVWLDQRRADVRGRRGEDDDPGAGGLRLALPDERLSG